jgi:hypothetical protein
MIPLFQSQFHQSTRSPVALLSEFPVTPTQPILWIYYRWMIRQPIRHLIQQIAHRDIEKFRHRCPSSFQHPISRAMIFR